MIKIQKKKENSLRIGGFSTFVIGIANNILILEN